MGMKRLTFLFGTALAGLVASGCVGGPIRSPNPVGHSSTHHDLATGEQFPLKSSASKDEVDRVFDERYPGTVNWLYVWGRDRWFDLMDVVSWDVGFGRGLGANVFLTEYGQAGLRWWDGLQWGQRGRAFGMWEVDATERGLGPFYWIEYERRPIWGTQTLFEHEYKYSGWDILEEGDSKVIHHDWSEVGGRLDAGMVSVGVAASPFEIVDFIAGLNPFSLIANIIGFHHPTWDIANDDVYSQIQKELEDEKGLSGE